MIRKLTFLIFALLLSALALPAGHAAALSSQSPNPTDMFNVTANPDKDNAAEHIIRVHKSGSIERMDFKAYFTSANATGRTLQLVKSNRGCHDSSIDNIGLRVTIQGTVYNRSATEACTGGYRTYNIPNGLPYNSNTGKYEASIRLELTNINFSQSAYTEDGKQETFAYLARVNAGGIIGQIGGAAKDEFGLVGHGAGYGIKYKMQFGLACNASAKSNFKATVWDPENTVFGTTRMWIEKNPPGTAGWTQLSHSEYGASDNVSWDSTNNRYNSTANSSGQSSYISVRTAIAGTGYRIVVYNPTTSPRAGSSNVYSVTVPSESIYGEVDCGYTLTPTLGTLGTSTNPGATIPISAPVDNSGTVASLPTQWRVTKVEYPSNIPLGDINGKQLGDGSGYSDDEPCAAARVVKDYNSGGNCDSAWNYVSNKSFTAGSNPFSKDYVAPNEPGKRVCFINSVSRPVGSTQTSLAWRHSVMRCSIIGSFKKPKVQVLGNDVRARGKITTSTSTGGAPAKTFGSWVEYGALSTGKNEGFGSAHSFRSGSDSVNQSGWSNLTFANTDDSYGEYILPPTPDIASFFDKLPGDNCASPLSNGVHNCGNVTLTGRADINGTVIIKSSGTVTISGDITYHGGPFASIGGLPQVIIVAKDIIINSNVKQVDAWLVTWDPGLKTHAGSIKTCESTPPLTKSTCSQQLRVNGPVLTDHLYLYRTAGSEDTDDASRAAPAEVFNLRPDAYLWAYNYGLARTQPVTDLVTELPPRF